MFDSKSPELVQGPQVLVEVYVVDTENLILARPDFVLAAFLLEDQCRWECIVDRAMPPIAAYSFVLADNKLVLAGGLCSRCRADPRLRQRLVDLYSKVFPSVSWKLSAITMPSVTQ